MFSLNRQSVFAILVFIVVGVVNADIVRADSAADWATPAEIANYRTTPTYDETMAYIRRVVSDTVYEHAGQVEMFKCSVPIPPRGTVPDGKATLIAATFPTAPNIRTGMNLAMC